MSVMWTSETLPKLSKFSRSASLIRPWLAARADQRPVPAPPTRAPVATAAWRNSRLEIMEIQTFSSIVVGR